MDQDLIDLLARFRKSNPELMQSIESYIDSKPLEFVRSLGIFGMYIICKLSKSARCLVALSLSE